MSKCPKCGCEFHETSFTTIVIDEKMPKDEIKIVNADGLNSHSRETPIPPDLPTTPPEHCIKWRY